jgi:Spy/CpxP family protein refolding chaperone
MMAKQRHFRLMAAMMITAALSAQAPAPGTEPPAALAPGACHGQGQAGLPPMGRGPQHSGMGPMGGGALRFLDRTAAQNKAVRDILDKHKPAMTDQHRILGAKAAALRDALEDPAASEAQLRSLAAVENSARLQMVLEQRAVFLAIQGVLTPDQQAKAERLRKKMQKERLAHEDVLDEIGEPKGPGPGLGL